MEREDRWNEIWLRSHTLDRSALCTRRLRHLWDAPSNLFYSFFFSFVFWIEFVCSMLNNTCVFKYIYFFRDENTLQIDIEEIKMIHEGSSLQIFTCVCIIHLFHYHMRCTVPSPEKKISWRKWCHALMMIIRSQKFMHFLFFLFFFFCRPLTIRHNCIIIMSRFYALLWDSFKFTRMNF